MISVLLKVWHYCQVCDRHIKWPHYNHIAASRHDIVTRSQCHNNVTSQCHKIRNSNYDQIRSAELWSCYLAGLGDVQRSTDNWMTHSKIFSVTRKYFSVTVWISSNVHWSPGGVHMTGHRCPPVPGVSTVKVAVRVEVRSRPRQSRDCDQVCGALPGPAPARSS